MIVILPNILKMPDMIGSIDISFPCASDNEELLLVLTCDETTADAIKASSAEGDEINDGIIDSESTVSSIVTIVSMV